MHVELSELEFGGGSAIESKLHLALRGGDMDCISFVFDDGGCFVDVGIGLEVNIEFLGVLGVPVVQVDG